MSSPRLSHFLAALPASQGLLGIVRGLARNQPHKVSSLTDLRKCVASLVPVGQQVLQPRQHDASEWILTLKEAIEKELPPVLRDQFVDMLKIVIEAEYQCSRCGYQDPKVAEEHMVLQLPVW